jgi:hypothetical protein
MVSVYTLAEPTKDGEVNGMNSPRLSTWYWRVIALTGALYIAAASAQQPGYFVIHGRPRSCANIVELDHARQRNDLRYFTGWTGQDYETAIAWASACSESGIPGWGPTRFQYLRALQERSQQLARQRADAQRTAAEQAAAAQAVKDNEAEARREQQAAEEKAEETRRAAAVREENARRVAAEKAAQARRECREGMPHKLFEARKAVQDDLAEKESWATALAKENKITELTGAENMTRKYYDGQGIVDADDRIARDFQEYKSAGGAANVPERVETSTQDPCTGLETQ